MENSQLSKTRDRLSELPDSLIFHIFSYVPITQVVRTTFLSKRWKDLWKTVPFFYLEDSTANHPDDQKRFRDFVNRALLVWTGTKICKFKIEFKRREPLESFVYDMDVWLLFAMHKSTAELEELEVHQHHKEYAVPRCLYSCSSLEVLSLKHCGLRIHESNNVTWDRLKSLTIHVDLAFIDQRVIGQILRGSPRLEVFVLSLMYIDHCLDVNLCIQSTSLKRLSIERMGNYYPWGYCELHIRAPNLETLEILGLIYDTFSLNASSLTDATLGFCGHGDCEYDDELDEMLEETLKQILPTIRYVERFTLSTDWCVKELGFLKRICLVSPFPMVKFLNLNANFSKFKQIVDLLEIFPKLERLVVIEDDDEYEDDQHSLKFEGNQPNSFLLELRTIEITWTASDNSIFPFVEILLKYASKLEKMVIRVKGIMPPSISLFSASQKLLKMPRSSPTAQLIFCEHS